MKKPDLLISIVIWQFMVAMTVAVGIAIYIVIFPIFIGEGDWSSIIGTDRMAGSIAGIALPSFFLFCLFLLALAGAIGLLLNKGHECAAGHPMYFEHPGAGLALIVRQEACKGRQYK